MKKLIFYCKMKNLVDRKHDAVFIIKAKDANSAGVGSVRMGNGLFEIDQCIENNKTNEKEIAVLKAEALDYTFYKCS